MREAKALKKGGKREGGAEEKKPLSLSQLRWHNVMVIYTLFDSLTQTHTSQTHAKPLLPRSLLPEV